jgi:type 1 fimbria pilin
MSLFNLLLSSVIGRLPSGQIAAHSVNTAANIHSSHRQNMIRHLVAWGALAFLMLGGRPIYAASCATPEQNFTQTINPGPITVPSGAQIGDVIATFHSTPSPPPQVVCNVTFISSGYNGVSVPGLNNVYSITGPYGPSAPGIGVRITAHTLQGDVYGALSANVQIPGHSVDSSQSQYTVEVIKIADQVGSGNVFPLGSQGSAFPLTMGNGTGLFPYGSQLEIVGGIPIIAPKPPTCSVQTPSIAVPMGNIPVSDFSGVGSSSPRTQPVKISLTCAGGDGSSPVSIYTTLTDNTNQANLTDVLSLTPSSQATGVGIQIMKDGTPLKYGPDSNAPGNTNQWYAGATTTAGQFDILLTAGYVQTLPTVTPGTANAVATFTMSYQ